jgi:hypothetical protein
MRERGPYEYDKFVLNILQLYNAVNLAEIHELVQATDGIESLNTISDSINSLYDSLVGTPNKSGVAEKVFVKHYNYKGEF